MNALLVAPINSVPEFLKHALELEEESAERYRELADAMDVHNNPEVAQLFNKLAEYGDQHANEVRVLAADYALPVIPPWDFKWSCPEAPESPCMEDAHYLMTTCQALELALHNERRGRDFYREVAKTSAYPEVQHLATRMAEEEDCHVGELEKMMITESCSIESVLEDLDPPNQPE